MMFSLNNALHDVEASRIPAFMGAPFRPKVLVVDDSTWEVEMLRSILEDDYDLEMLGYETDTFEKVKSEKPHLILLDMIMPGVEGIEVLQRLKADVETQCIPVIMLTAYSINEDYAVRAIELGAYDYLHKPVSEKILKVKISQAVRMLYTESSLHDTLAYNNQLLDAVQSAIIGVDANDRIKYWNRKAERFFDLTKEQVLGKQIGDLALAWNWDKISAEIMNCLQKQVYSSQFDVEYKPRDSGSNILSISIAPFFDVVEKKSGYLMLADNVTKQRIQQSQFHHAEKLQSIGQLAAGIAHEINTPIQYVGDNTRFLQDSFQDLIQVINGAQQLTQNLNSGQDITAFKNDFTELYENFDYEYLVEDVPKAIEQSLEGIERVTTIVKAMKDFSHPGSENRDPTDINRAIDSTITVARNVWKYVADVETDFDPAMGELPCYAGPFNEVILNIIVNAAHAIGAVVGDGDRGKGLITVSTRRYETYGEIRISDTGTGIPEHVQAKIFDPFFTTKEVGKGTGQGLSLSHIIIVEQHGGELFFKTEVGKGTTFVIRLPTECTENE